MRALFCWMVAGTLFGFGQVADGEERDGEMVAIRRPAASVDIALDLFPDDMETVIVVNQPINWAEKNEPRKDNITTYQSVPGGTKVTEYRKVNGKITESTEHHEVNGKTTEVKEYRLVNGKWIEIEIEVVRKTFSPQEKFHEFMSLTGVGMLATVIPQEAARRIDGGDVLLTSAREFRSEVRIGGGSKCDGCQVLITRRPVSEQLIREIAAGANETIEYKGRKILRYKKDDEEFFVTQPASRCLAACTSVALARQLVDGASNSQGKGAFRAEILKHTDEATRRSPVWAVRLYRPASAMTSDSTMLRVDDQARGLTFTLSGEKDSPLVVRYLSPNKKGHDAFRKLLADEYELPVARERAENETLELHAPLGDPQAAGAISPGDAAFTMQFLLGFSVYP